VWHTPIKKTYSVYITTNVHKKVLYTGITNNVGQRITGHYLSSLAAITTAFTGRYNAYWLI
jgi:putative endonuclease